MVERLNPDMAGPSSTCPSIEDDLKLELQRALPLDGGRSRPQRRRHRTPDDNMTTRQRQKTASPTKQKMEIIVDSLKEQTLARDEVDGLSVESEAASISNSTVQPSLPDMSTNEEDTVMAGPQADSEKAKARATKIRRKRDSILGGPLSNVRTNELVAEMISGRQQCNVHDAPLPRPIERPTVSRQAQPSGNEIIEPDIPFQQLEVDEGYADENDDPGWLDSFTTEMMERANGARHFRHFGHSRPSTAPGTWTKCQKLVKHTPRMRRRKGDGRTHSSARSDDPAAGPSNPAPEL